MADYVPQLILHKIEQCIQQNLQAMERGLSPSYTFLRRETKAVEWDEQSGILVHGGEKKTVFLSSRSGRKFTAISLVLETVHALLKDKKTVTQREIYYMHQFFKNQAEADEAILDVSALLQVPRSSLNIAGATKGCFAGSVHVKVQNTWRDCRVAGQGGIAITQDFLQLGEDQIESDARFIIIVEKDGIFNRLREDRFYRDIPSILVCGKGFPDLATRAFARKLQDTLHLPVVGLADCNPFGLSVLLTYKLGSARMPLDSAQYTVDVKWIGLRPSSIAECNFPGHVFQPFSSLDFEKTKKLSSSEFVQHHPRYKYEVQAFLHLQQKIELEALHTLSFTAMASFLKNSLLKCDFF